MSVTILGIYIPFHHLNHLVLIRSSSSQHLMRQLLWYSMRSIASCVLVRLIPTGIPTVIISGKEILTMRSGQKHLLLSEGEAEMEE